MDFKFDLDHPICKQIEQEIESSTSPVGIDAKKTHIIILQLLLDIEKRLTKLEHKLNVTGK